MGDAEMRIQWKPIAIWVGICEAVGLLAGLLIREGTEIYAMTAQKPPLSPPEWLFPVVWAILYALMGIGGGMVAQAEPGEARSKGLNLLVAQLVVNFFWPLLFFNARVYGFSLGWLLLLWVLVLWMIFSFRRCNRTAARLQVPYLLWLSFAVYLNGGVWLLNS